MPNWKKVTVSGSAASFSSLSIDTSITASIISSSQFTGSLFGTASFATQALSASYAPGGGGASFPYTGSAIISGSLIVTGSLNVSQGITGSLLGTASYAIQALSASYAPGGAGGVAFPFSGSAQITGSLGVTGSVTATSVIETSALRFKQNIHSLDSADSIYKLRPVTFDWKTTLKSDIGFIAEEVNEVIPVLAELNENGEAEGVKYSKLSALLTKALQIHEQRLESHQQEIEQLKQEINHLKNK